MRIRHLAPVPAVLVALLVLSAPLGAEIIEEIVAMINDQVITKTDVEEREGLLVQDLFQKYAGDELDRKMEEGRRTILRDMVAERLLLERAETLLDMKKVRDSILQDFMKRNNIRDREQLARLLEQEGLTVERFTDSLVRIAVPQEVLNFEVRSKVEVDEVQMIAYYEEHLDEYRIPETVEFRELVVLNGEEEPQEVRARVEGYRREILDGADFIQAIREHSDAPSRTNDGLVGPFRRDELVEAIANVVFSLREGDLSEPVEMPHGFHLIRLETHQEATTRSFEEVRPEIREALLAEVLDGKINEYIMKIWQESYVFIYPRYRDRLDQEFLDISDLSTDTTTTAASP